MFSSNTSQVSSDAVYVEDVFSNFLYTGNGSTQTITNGIDLAGEGGMVWIKSRSATTNHFLFDTERGTTDELNSNTTDAEASLANSLTAFNADGFSIGSATGIGVNGATYASWTFRKQPKFFDVVTYTGDGSANRNISHALGSAPGCVIVKGINQATNWFVWHRSGTQTNESAARLNTTAAYSAGGNTYWGSPTSGTPSMTSTTFSVGDALNVSTYTYVAYVFAHNAGGFGESGTDNVISCGSYTGNGGINPITLGYEPQWLIIKRANSTADWWLSDVSRDMSTTGYSALNPNLSSAEYTAGNQVFYPTATGFEINNAGSLAWNASGNTYIYIAIRRGPMRTPTSGTSVFAIDTAGSTAPNPPAFDSGFPVDAALQRFVSDINENLLGARLTSGQYLQTQSTAAQVSDTSWTFDYQNGWRNITTVNSNIYSWMFRRAPGFFDVVCWTGTQSTVTHGLGVVPEIVITKVRSTTGNWDVQAIQSGSSNYQFLRLETTGAKLFDVAAPTSTTFAPFSQASGATYVAYLFATCPGVSKVGSYTGNGSSQTINMGFTGGARFFLVKRTDNTGDWWWWDSARGIVAGNDPALRLNSDAAQSTVQDVVDTDSSGIIVNQTSTFNINVNGATYIYLGIA